MVASCHAPLRCNQHVTARAAVCSQRGAARCCRARPAHLLFLRQPQTAAVLPHLPSPRPPEASLGRLRPSRPGWRELEGRLNFVFYSNDKKMFQKITVPSEPT
ncbi:Protein of unknown function [Gryllus bimaculatus]|nr:Protein of unknown function [Gryllus bimaculatus]